MDANMGIVRENVVSCVTKSHVFSLARKRCYVATHVRVIVESHVRRSALSAMQKSFLISM